MLDRTRAHVLGLRREKTLPPAKGTEIPVGVFARYRLARDLRHYLHTGRHYQRRAVWARRLFVGLAAVGAGVGAGYVAPVPPAGSIAAGLGVFALSFLLFAVIRDGVARMSPPHAGLRKAFDRHHAPIWSERAAECLAHCLTRKVAEPLETFRADRENPYRILRAFAPMPDFSLRRPAATIKGGVSAAALADRERRLFEIDACCGGVLHLLSAKAEPRFTDGGDNADPVVHDLYWRADIQELPDTFQSDVFLRFHQSTIERVITNTCRYKTYVCLNNFRRSPLLLLRVKDVVAFLRGDPGCDPERVSMIFRGLPLVTPESVLSLLKANAYFRFPPRIERVHAQRYDPQDGALLFEGEGDDWVMSFDPARVWIKQGMRDSQRHIEALSALRNAIHMASRDRAIKVALKKRDVLLLDNRRMLIGRQEDAPSFSIRDGLASCFKSLEGRWLRKTYGFPSDEFGGWDNFRRITGPAIDTARELEADDAAAVPPHDPDAQPFKATRDL